MATNDNLKTTLAVARSLTAIRQQRDALLAECKEARETLGLIDMFSMAAGAVRMIRKAEGKLDAAIAACESAQGEG